MKNETKNILNELTQRKQELCSCTEDIAFAFNILKASFLNDRKLLVCGNGGSAADSGHICGELIKNFKLNRGIKKTDAYKLKDLYADDSESSLLLLQQALPAISLPELTTALTAISNDGLFDMVFAQMIYALGREGDVLLVLTTSGNSFNLINAVKVANIIGMKTIGLTGESGGLVMKHLHCCIRAPAIETYLVQEYHVSIYHALCGMLEFEFFGC